MEAGLNIKELHLIGQMCEGSIWFVKPFKIILGCVCLSQSTPNLIYKINISLMIKKLSERHVK